MANDILVIAEHLDGKLADISYEMAGKAKALAAELGGKAVTVVLGSGAKSLAGSLDGDATLYIDDPALAEFNPEAYGGVIAALVKERGPRVVMFGYTSMGMDVASWLSVAVGAPHVAYVTGLSASGGVITATSKLYGGKIMAESALDGGTSIVSVLAGSFPAEAGKGNAPVEQIASPVPLGDLKIKFVKLIKPAGGDVDITTQTKLVSVGRGIGGAENIELAEELAKALGAVVSASRPVTDAGWLPKTRQVGKSGVTVKPKLYLMLGISGAPEHLEGMRGAELVIAINTDAKAPIFDIAHYGTTCDLFDVTEALIEKLGG
jgi:electron transfer flavoprotein alpha subunit